MKKLICSVLCLLVVSCLFAGCAKTDNTATDTPTVPSLAETQAPPSDAANAEVEGIHYCGITSMDVSAQQLADAVGVDVDSVVTTATGNNEELLLLNDVTYAGISYSQLQCINASDKTMLTLTYTLGSTETLTDALESICESIADPYGEPSESTTGSGAAIFTWHQSSVNDNYICLYPINDTELKLSFYVY